MLKLMGHRFLRSQTVELELADGGFQAPQSCA